MSNLILPVFPGLEWNVSRKAVWSTLKKESVSGRVYANSLWSYPKWQYKMSYSVLRARPTLTEMQQLAGFFNLNKGDGDTWLFADPDDSSVTDQPLGVGNGTQTAFQAVRAFGGFTEPIFELNTVTAVKVSGSSVSFSFEAHTGIITLAAAPASSAPVTWTGTFYFRCRFLASLMDFNQFMKQFWELRTLEFITDKP